MASAVEQRRFAWFVAAVVALDLITKLLAEWLLRPHRPVTIIGDVVRLQLAYNQGAAFGLNVGSHSRWVFMGLAVVALLVLGSMVRTTGPGNRLRLYALAAVCGGAAGNLLDRIRSPEGVVDFLDVGVGATRWPTFNVADSAVTCGALALALSLWNQDQSERSSRSP